MSYSLCLVDAREEQTILQVLLLSDSAVASLIASICQLLVNSASSVDGLRSIARLMSEGQRRKHWGRRTALLRPRLGLGRYKNRKELLRYPSIGTAAGASLLLRIVAITITSKLTAHTSPCPLCLYMFAS